MTGNVDEEEKDQDETDPADDNQIEDDKNDVDNSDHDEKDEGINIVGNEPQGDADKYGYTYKIGQIRYVDDENSFLLAFPQITFADGRSADEINETIRRCASYQMDLMYPVFCYNPDLYQGRCESEVSYEVMYFDENIFSVRFYDHYFVGSIFAEYADYRALTIDLNTGDVFKLGAVINPDDKFCEKMHDKMIEQDEEWAERNALDASIMKQAFTNGVSSDNRYYADLYITKDEEVGIAFSYHYSDGSLITRGCVDLVASDKEINKIKRDSKLWDYLGK